MPILADSAWLTGNMETISLFDRLPDRKSKLSIRMVAGLAEVVERKRFRGCGGPIRTECAIPEHSVPQRIDPLHRVSPMLSITDQ
jgi:hypothetical protein